MFCGHKYILFMLLKRKQANAQCLVQGQMAPTDSSSQCSQLSSWKRCVWGEFTQGAQNTPREHASNSVWWTSGAPHSAWSPSLHLFFTPLNVKIPRGAKDPSAKEKGKPQSWAAAENYQALLFRQGCSSKDGGGSIKDLLEHKSRSFPL